MSREAYTYRTRLIENTVRLILYLCGGWRTYQDITAEFGWAVTVGNKNRTARRNVRALEAAGLPVEWRRPPDEPGWGEKQSVRLSPDWVVRTPWLRRYIIRKQPVQVRKGFYK